MLLDAQIQAANAFLQLAAVSISENWRTRYTDFSNRQDAIALEILNTRPTTLAGL